jgi:hypothetical protein
MAFGKVVIRLMAKGNNGGHVGRPTKYPGKRRDLPVQVALSDEGLEALAAGCARTGYSKAVYIEFLIRQEDDKHIRPKGFARSR